jgi:hypothetical protein
LAFPQKKKKKTQVLRVEAVLIGLDAVVIMRRMETSSDHRREKASFIKSIPTWHFEVSTCVHGIARAPIRKPMI